MKIAKKLAVMGMSLVLAFSMTACGNDNDTKETVTKTIKDCSAIMNEAMTEMGTGVVALMSLSDPSEIAGSVEPVVNKMDDALKELDAVETAGGDSSKFRNYVKDYVTVVKDMFSDFGKMSEISEAEEIENKYSGRMDELTKETEEFSKELGDKYGIDVDSLMEEEDTFSEDTGDTESTEGEESETTEEQ